MPQVAVISRTGTTTRARCAYCHGDADRVRPCVTCKALLHPECWLSAGRCPTLGCSIVVRRTGQQQAAPRRGGRRRPAQAWLMPALQAATLLGLLCSGAAIAVWYHQEPRPAHVVILDHAPRSDRAPDRDPEALADQRFRIRLGFEDWFVAPAVEAEKLEGTRAGLERLGHGRTFEDERLLGFTALVQGDRDRARQAFAQAAVHRPRDAFTAAWLVSLDCAQPSRGLEPAWLGIVRRAATEGDWDQRLEEAFFIADGVERCLALSHMALLAEVRGRTELATFLFRDAASIEGDAERYWQHRLATLRVARQPTD